jgi:HSP20 family protein
LPGIPKEKINIDFNEGVLTISGERSEERREEGTTYHRMERSYGKFMRQFALPQDVDPSAINASYKDGVLEVVVPKPEQKRTRINIQ